MHSISKGEIIFNRVVWLSYKTFLRTMNPSRLTIGRENKTRRRYARNERTILNYYYSIVRVIISNDKIEKWWRNPENKENNRRTRTGAKFTVQLLNRNVYTGILETGVAMSGELFQPEEKTNCGIFFLN